MHGREIRERVEAGRGLGFRAGGAGRLSASVRPSFPLLSLA